MQMIHVGAVRARKRKEKFERDKRKGKMEPSEMTVKRWGEKWDIPGEDMAKTAESIGMRYGGGDDDGE